MSNEVNQRQLHGGGRSIFYFSDAGEESPASFVNFSSTEENELLKPLEETPEVIEQQVQQTEIEQVDQPVVPEVTPPASDTSFYEQYKNLVKLGLVENHKSITLEDGTEIEIKDFLNSQESLNQLLASIKESREEFEKEKSKALVDVSGLDELRQNIVQIIIAGGDISQASQDYNLVRSIEDNIDIKTEEGQMKAIVVYNRSKGISDEITKAAITQWKSSGELPIKGQEFYNLFMEEKGKAIEEQKQAYATQVLQEQETLKKQRSDIRTILKSKGVTEAKTRTLVDKYLDRTPDGGYALDKLYLDKWKSMDEVADLILFMDNKEEYNRSISSSQVNQAKLNLTKKFTQGTNGGSLSMSIGDKSVGNIVPKPTTSVQQVVSPAQEPDFVPEGGRIKVKFNDF